MQRRGDAERILNGNRSKNSSASLSLCGETKKALQRAPVRKARRLRERWPCFDHDVGMGIELDLRRIARVGLAVHPHFERQLRAALRRGRLRLAERLAPHLEEVAER